MSKSLLGRTLEKIKTALWFLKRPSMYPQLLYLVKLRMSPHPKENTLKTSTEWCESHSISAAEAIEKLFGHNTFKSFDNDYPKLIASAKDIESKIPVQMGHGGDTDLLYNVCLNLKPEKIAETGVAHGWSSLAILATLKSNGQLISTDMPYPKMNNEEYVGCVIPDQLKTNWKLIRKPDRQGLPKALKEMRRIDLCHYDSDKTYVGRMWAYPLLWKFLRKGGIFISDDINDNIAFKDFCEKLKIQPMVVEFQTKFIGILVKED